MFVTESPSASEVDWFMQVMFCVGLGELGVIKGVEWVGGLFPDGAV